MLPMSFIFPVQVVLCPSCTQVPCTDINSAYKSDVSQLASLTLESAQLPTPTLSCFFSRTATARMILILLYLNYLRVLLVKLGPHDGRRFQYPRVHPGGITWMFVRITRPVVTRASESLNGRPSRSMAVILGRGLSDHSIIFATRRFLSLHSSSGIDTESVRAQGSQGHTDITYSLVSIDVT